MAFAGVPGLLSRRCSQVPTWSLPMTTASGCLLGEISGFILCQPKSQIVGASPVLGAFIDVRRYLLER